MIPDVKLHSTKISFGGRGKWECRPLIRNFWKYYIYTCTPQRLRVISLEHTVVWLVFLRQPLLAGTVCTAQYFFSANSQETTLVVCKYVTYILLTLLNKHFTLPHAHQSLATRTNPNPKPLTLTTIP